MLGLVGATLAACSSDGRETIQFAFAKPEAIPYMRELVQEYNAMAPAIIVYLFTQRWVMEGVTQGAVKG